MRSSLRSRPWRVLPALAAVAAALALLPSLAAAQQRHGGIGRAIPATAGIVQSTPGAAATSFTIKTRGGTVETIDVSTTGTAYLERGQGSASLADVQANDLVAVFGTVSGTTVTASEVVIAVPHGNSSNLGTPATAGVVQATPATGASSFAITTRGGVTETIDVGSGTTYYECGVNSASLANVQQGDIVVVFGTSSGATVQAQTVVIHTRMRGALAAGGIAQQTPGSSATSFTIQTRQGVLLTVDVDPTTTHYYERGVTNPSIADVQQGDRVAVFGTLNGSTITATAVLIAPPPPASPSATFATAGSVQTAPVGSASNATFVIETFGHMQVTVDVTGSTTYSERGQSNATLQNVGVGDYVAVFGTLNGSTATATEVVICALGNGGGHPWQRNPQGQTGPSGPTWQGGQPRWQRSSGQGQTGQSWQGQNRRRQGRRA